MNNLLEKSKSLEHSHPSITTKPTAETGLWIFILVDLCLFSSYFAAFLLDKSTQPIIFAEGQATLARHLGGINTVLLLVSSWFMARTVNAARLGEIDACRKGIRHTMVCGCLFLLVKFVEYSDKFSADLVINTNNFYRDYFTFTGFHMLHVIIGLSFLAWIHFAYTDKISLEENTHIVEGVGLYWHMVDLLWVVLFSLIYLVP